MQLVRQCDDEELMEVVLPRLSSVITLWEFLMMKVESPDNPQLPVDQVLQEYLALHKKVRVRELVFGCIEVRSACALHIRYS